MFGLGSRPYQRSCLAREFWGWMWLGQGQCAPEPALASPASHLIVTVLGSGLRTFCLWDPPTAPKCSEHSPRHKEATFY